MKPDATRIKRVWERASLYIVFAAVVVAVLGLAYGIQQSHQTKILAGETKTLAQANLISQTNHHAASVKQQNTIIAQNKEITSLLLQHSGDLAFTNTLLKELAAAGKIETALATYLVDSQVAVCEATHATCPPPYRVP